MRAEELRALYGGDAAGAAELERLGFASYMCVPMHGHDHVLGTIDVRDRRFGAAASTRPTSRSPRSSARRAAVAVENALLFREAEERGRAARVLAAVADGVFLVDAEGVIRLWNPAAEAITGLPAADVLDLPAVGGDPGLGTVVAPGSGVGCGRATPRLGPRRCRSRSAAASSGSRSPASASPDGTVYAFRDLTAGARARGDEGRVRLDRLARAADAAGGDLRRRDDPPAAATSPTSRSQRASCST